MEFFLEPEPEPFTSGGVADWHQVGRVRGHGCLLQVPGWSRGHLPFAGIRSSRGWCPFPTPKKKTPRPVCRDSRFEYSQLFTDTPSERTGVSVAVQILAHWARVISGAGILRGFPSCKRAAALMMYIVRLLSVLTRDGRTCRDRHVES